MLDVAAVLDPPLGALKNVKLNIQIDHSVQACVQKPGRLPFLMKKHVENKIQKLLVRYFSGFLKWETSSSKWVSPSVCVPKKNEDIRLCVDMRKVNIAIIRNYYPTPTLDKILSLVIGAKIFSKLDFAQGYHQIVLDEKSKDIRTFSTPQGLFQYKRLISPAKNAFEGLQKTVVTNITHDINGVFNISDDVIAHATNQNEHLEQLRNFFDKIQEKDLKLNFKKYESG